MFVIWNEEGGGEGGDNDAAEAAAKAAAERAEAEKNKTQPTDAEAKLLREVMEKKEALAKAKQAATDAENRAKELETKLASFDGVDLEKVKGLLKEAEDRENAELAKAGDWERLKAKMAEEHTKALTEKETEANARLSELSEKLTKREREIHELTIGRSFSESNFIKDALLLTPSKARIVYGGHFELKDGKVVGYDKPAGSAERTPIVDGNGEPLPFDKAIEKLIEADPDRDNLLKSKMRNGAGSENDSASRVKVKTQELKGAARIAAAVADGKMPQLPK